MDTTIGWSVIAFALSLSVCGCGGDDDTVADAGVDGGDGSAPSDDSVEGVLTALGVDIAPTPRLDGDGDALPDSYGPLVDAVCKKLVFRTLAPAHRDAALVFLGKTAADPLAKGDAAVNWRLPYLVALILDSPYHGIR